MCIINVGICYDSFLTFHMFNYYNRYYDPPTSLAF